MLTFLAKAYLYFVAFTSRIRLVSDHQESILFLRESRPAIYTFWFQHVFFLLYFFSGYRMSILMPPQGRTDLITRLSSWMGLNVAKGSIEGGGRHALVTLIEHIKQGKAVLTPADGPRAPEKKCKASCFIVAQETHAPLIPVGWHSKFHIKLPMKSYPFYIPLPFNLIEIRLGEPIQITRHHNLQELDGIKLQLTQQLNAIISPHQDHNLVVESKKDLQAADH